MTGWKKVASVTPGGKPYFYFRQEPGRQWIVFDRILKTWCLQINGNETYHRTPEQAAIAADKP